MIHPDLPDNPDHAQDERVNRVAVSMSSVQFSAIFVVGVRSRQLEVQRASSLSDVLSSSSSRRLVLTSPASSPSVAAGLKMEAAIPGLLGGYQRVTPLALPRS